VTSRILQPEGWPRPSGYANGVTARGQTVFVAGQIGWNPITGVIESDDFAAQARQALRNVVAVLRSGDAEPRHVVKLTWFITDKPAYLAARKAVGDAYRDVFGGHYPAMSVVVLRELIENRAKVEIEATAIIDD
jgi:enamine deaminase RidA (YjgF/YER057c/UK114 family)